MELKKKRHQDDCKHNEGHHDDEIPNKLRQELNLPMEMEFIEIDYYQVKQKDASMKRLRPIWSGQDVIPIKFDQDKSQQVID